MAKRKKVFPLSLLSALPLWDSNKDLKTIYTQWIIQLNFTSLRYCQNFWLNCISKHCKRKPELSNQQVRKTCAPCFLIAKMPRTMTSLIKAVEELLPDVKRIIEN